ncbi:flagellar biosynthesis anti-sigma factor FlgM [Alkalibacterium olivapovliticus]|uniref:Negative regulator of flagellin synthesis n=1 Tax=Alkalibacterium olivapovliticus TaxID=99907 RepID=A0A2T0VYQ1_9LACT|nr:flagellar biosynthesis anti-sigma factor FlgM [Alkalibacterium olivapovliticus]PRY77488.1 flagellar biosynthesis anti-sigma factor FlgM [Alkalibacterium olivapovliticus]
MKINKYTNVVSSVNQSKQAKREVVQETNKPQAKEADKVSISKEAQALLDADKAAFSERVNAIKQSIQNGEYQVDPSKITEGLVKSLQEQKEL